MRQQLVDLSRGVQRLRPIIYLLFKKGLYGFQIVGRKCAFAYPCSLNFSVIFSRLVILLIRNRFSGGADTRTLGPTRRSPSSLEIS